jgi:hypothetical protein
VVKGLPSALRWRVYHCALHYQLTPKEDCVNSIRTVLPLMVVAVLVASSGCGPAAVPRLETLPAVTVLTVREENAALRYSVDVEYPQLSGRVPVDVKQKINAAIADMVLADIAGVRENAQSDAAWAEQNPDGDTSVTLDQSSMLRAEFEIPYLAVDMVSVRIRFDSYTAGAAHGMTYTRVLNARLTDGVTLETADLFVDARAGLDLLSRLCAEDLKRQYGPDYEALKTFVEDGTSPVPDNFRSVALEPGWIVVSFDPYQVGPYASGPREVRIAVADMGTTLAITVSPDAFSLTRGTGG